MKGEEKERGIRWRRGGKEEKAFVFVCVCVCVRVHVCVHAHMCTYVSAHFICVCAVATALYASAYLSVVASNPPVLCSSFPAQQ